MPSLVMFVNDVRIPLIAVSWKALLCTPGCSVVNASGLRVSSGSDMICCGLTVLLTCAVVEVTTSAPAVTVTFSVSAPYSIVGLNAYSRPTSILTSLAMNVLNPADVIVTV